MMNFIKKKILDLNRISDQCSKPVKSKYYLFELVGKDQNDIEIFGANDVTERAVCKSTLRWDRF
jgi:hypothetical protein